MAAGANAFAATTAASNAHAARNKTADFFLPTQIIFIFHRRVSLF